MAAGGRGAGAASLTWVQIDMAFGSRPVMPIPPAQSEILLISSLGG